MYSPYNSAFGHAGPYYGVTGGPTGGPPPARSTRAGPPQSLETPVSSQVQMEKGQQRYDIKIGGRDTTDTIPAILIVDSAQRNRDLYENPGHYTITLGKEYTEVVSVELVQANIPNSAYMVGPNNNKVGFQYSAGADSSTRASYTAVLNPGNYEPTALASELARALNSTLSLTGTNKIFTVSYNLLSQQLTVTSPSRAMGSDAQLANNGFILSAGLLGGADGVLGLGGTNVTAANNPTGAARVTLPHIVVSHPNRYVALSIRGMERCDGNSTALAGAFCIIPMEVDGGCGDFSLTTGDKIDNDTYIYYYSSPLPKLRQLDITFYAPDGTVYDFNGQDHILIFKIHCLSRAAKLC